MKTSPAQPIVSWQGGKIPPIIFSCGQCDREDVDMIMKPVICESPHMYGKVFKRKYIVLF